jgi:hypothetical protein
MNIFAVAWSGIAATLLEETVTAHEEFKRSWNLTSTEKRISSIGGTSVRIKFYKNALFVTYGSFSSICEFAKYLEIILWWSEYLKNLGSCKVF